MRLAKKIISRIDAIEHTAYCEPFVGMGGVFFRRNMRPKAEFINDYNGEVVNLFILRLTNKIVLQPLAKSFNLASTIKH
ncbi:MAG: DNA adenine methylase, partial [Rhizobiales bacterium]|nr:DNA adenine methylase [Hyphomicrobiales bacterium]